MVSNEPTLRENDVTGDKGIELCLSEENDVDYDHFLNLMTSTNSNFSMDSSNCSENTSIESSPTIQRTETGNISTNDFEDDSESANSESANESASVEGADFDSSDSSENTSVESLFVIERMNINTNSTSTAGFEGGSATAIQKEDNGNISKDDFEDYGEYDQCRLSFSELASKRLYCMAAERSKRILILGERLSESIGKHHGTTSILLDNARSVHKKTLQPTA